MESLIYIIPYIWSLAYTDKKFLDLKNIEQLPSNPAGRTSVYYKLKILHIYIYITNKYLNIRLPNI